MKTLIWLLASLFCLAPNTTAADSRMLADFESRNHYWRLADWGDKGSLEIVDQHASSGNKALMIRFTPDDATKGKGLVLERDLTNFAQTFDRVTIDIYTQLARDNIGIALAVDTDQYYESEPFALHQGWNEGISFDLTESMFKASSTNWQYQAAVNLTRDPQKLMFLLYREGLKEGAFYVDNIRVSHREDGLPQKSTANSEHQPRSKKDHYRPDDLPVDIFIIP
jgi:hypothetical protein